MNTPRAFTTNPSYDRHARIPRAFTLVELLVVVAVIVVLLALMMPAMDKAIEASERAVCAARLDAWGVAIPQYALENKRKILPTVKLNAASPYPNLVRPLNAHGPGDFSAEAMAPYIGGVDLQRFYFGKFFYCPSNSAPTKEQTNAAIAAGNIASLNGIWFVADYAYFGRSDLWNNQNFATKPQELAGKGLGEGKLLMADSLYLWRGGGTDTMWYNHSDNGYSTHDVAWGGPVHHRTYLTGLSGTNQLMGDGSVAWKDRTKFNIQAMIDVTLEAGFVSGGAGPNPAVDLCFY